MIATPWSQRKEKGFLWKEKNATRIKSIPVPMTVSRSGEAVVHCNDNQCGQQHAWGSRWTGLTTPSPPPQTRTPYPPPPLWCPPPPTTPAPSASACASHSSAPPSLPPSPSLRSWISSSASWLRHARWRCWWTASLPRVPSWGPPPSICILIVL